MERNISKYKVPKEVETILRLRDGRAYTIRASDADDDAAFAYSILSGEWPDMPRLVYVNVFTGTNPADSDRPIFDFGGEIFYLAPFGRSATWVADSHSADWGEISYQLFYKGRYKASNILLFDLDFSDESQESIFAQDFPLAKLMSAILHACSLLATRDASNNIFREYCVNLFAVYGNSNLYTSDEKWEDKLWAEAADRSDTMMYDTEAPLTGYDDGFIGVVRNARRQMQKKRDDRILSYWDPNEIHE